jgi:hypothetical protein
MTSLNKVISLTGLILTVFGFSVYGETVTAASGFWDYDNCQPQTPHPCLPSNKCVNKAGGACFIGQTGTCCQDAMNMCDLFCTY